MIVTECKTNLFVRQMVFGSRGGGGGGGSSTNNRRYQTASAKKSPTFRCKECGGPHGGGNKDYCPDCAKKLGEPWPDDKALKLT